MCILTSFLELDYSFLDMSALEEHRFRHFISVSYLLTCFMVCDFIRALVSTDAKLTKTFITFILLKGPQLTNLTFFLALTFFISVVFCI